MLRYKVADVYTKHPTLETERLILRQLTRDDAESLYAIASVPEVSRYLMWDRHTSLKYTKHYLKDILRMYESLEYFEWGVVTKSDVRLIGTCGYTKFDYPINRGEIGYSFAPDVWGKGYATEAARATIAFGFNELHLASVCACFALENAASIHVLQKCGMQYTGEEQPMKIKGEWLRVGGASLSQNDYLQKAEEQGNANQAYRLMTRV